MKAPRETDLVKQLLQYLNLRGIFAWRNNTGAVGATSASGKRRFIRFGLVGSADILGVLPGGRFLAIEAKMPGERPTPAQAAFLQTVARQGGLALVVRRLEELQTALEDLEQVKR